MATLTRAATAARTATVTASDVRVVLAMFQTEARAIARAAEALQVVRDYDDKAYADIAIFALNDLISAARLQFHLDGEMVREHVYAVSDEALAAFGPPLERPPLASGFPPGTRLRITVTRNPHAPPDLCDDLFRELGWSAAVPLGVPGGLREEHYGTFASGGYAVERHLRANPRFDQPAGPGAAFAPKGR